ncbi:MAG: phosphotransferase [Moritella sp.]|uniref:phosphotransferase n=1 Tax=Moritella sp. TaxID=78556 RepID=UPI0029A47010|nr:phosphotransferase [Moritella sp.]MDX2322443.1 phosphotransferase [Moritella sp.]
MSLTPESHTSADSTPEFVVQFSPQSFSLQPVLGGLSNHNYRLQFQQHGLNNSYFVRLFSATYSDMSKHADHEYAAQIQAASIGLAPNIIVQHSQGMICDWIIGKHWDQVDQVRDENIAKIAQLVATLHQQPKPSHHLDMSERLQHYYQTLNSEFKTTALEQQLALTINLIEQHLPANRMGFCHHDMNPLNFIENEQTKLYLLDWEFAAAGHCDFDIATLFQTFAWQGSQRTLFLSYYNHYHPAAKVTFEQLDVMAVVVEMMTLLWCIVMYQQDKDGIYLTLWQQSERAVADKINLLNKELTWDQ